jgi:hypothetical protein
MLLMRMLVLTSQHVPIISRIDNLILNVFSISLILTVTRMGNRVTTLLLECILLSLQRRNRAEQSAVTLLVEHHRTLADAYDIYMIECFDESAMPSNLSR